MAVSRYLENWEAFRHVLTVTFVAVLWLVALCLGGVTCWGLYNVFAIYRDGEDRAYIEGAHHAGLAAKK